MYKYKFISKEKLQEHDRLANSIKNTEEAMKKHEDEFNQHVEEYGYKRKESQRILVMIGKTGHGKSTLGNRICGDKSKSGDKGPFKVSARMDQAGTTNVTSPTTAAPFDNLEKKEPNDSDEVQPAQSLLIVDTPGWGDLKADNRELCYSFQICLNIYFVLCTIFKNCTIMQPP